MVKRVRSVACASAGVALLLSASALTGSSKSGDSRYAGKDWSAPGGDEGASRYSTLEAITTKSVGRLGGAWVTDLSERTEATPLVSHGRMFIVSQTGQITALNPATGATLWTFKPEVPLNAKRGVGMGEGLLFGGLRDSNVVAVSQETGQIVWTSHHGPDVPSQGVSAAPAYGNGVVVAVASLGDNFLRGRAIAYDAKTGKQLWSFDVVPGPGEPGHETWPQDSDIWKYGGGALWTTPAVDSELGLVYLGTGNAVPQYGGELRPGDNLYDNCVVALDLKTGKLRWYYQVIHHDIWEHDLGTPLLVYDVSLGGRTRKALAAMRTDGMLFVLDRETGKPLIPVEERQVKQNAFLKTSPTQPFTVGADRVGPGCVDPSMIPSGFIAGCYFDPITIDKPNQFLPHMNMRQTPMAFSPQARDLYAVGCVNPAWMRRADTGWEFIQPVRLPGEKQYGVLAALDASTAKIKWQKKLPYSECEGSGGALATAGGLMFHEEPDGVLQAYDAKSGQVLWQFQTGQVGLGGGAGPSAASPMSYEIDGEQYIAVANNRAVWAFKLGGTVAARPAPTPPAMVREWTGQIADTGKIQLGAIRVFNINSAAKRIEWNNEYDLAPNRLRIKAGSALTFTNSTKITHTIMSRGGTWRTSAIGPGSSAVVTVQKPGTYEFICSEHPWTIGQLIVE